MTNDKLSGHLSAPKIESRVPVDFFALSVPQTKDAKKSTDTRLLFFVTDKCADDLDLQSTTTPLLRLTAPDGKHYDGFIKLTIKIIKL